MSDVERAAQLIAASAGGGQPVVSFTGAGVSQESGIPTFRGDDSIWQQYDPEQVATPEGFLADPALSWRFHEQLRGMCSASAPNPAHLSLAWIETALRDHAPTPVVTQNIDGLHQTAGSTEVVELHGTCHRMRCTQCEYFTDEMPEEFDHIPPMCECGGLLRPDVVWFGEQLPTDAMTEAQRWAQVAGVMLVIGTSATVQPAASLPVVALRSGAAVIEVNREATPLSPIVDVSLRGAAGEIMPELAEAVGTVLNGT